MNIKKILNRINFFKKRKKVISLNYFSERVAAIATQYNETYYHVSIGLQTSSYCSPIYDFKAYINGFNYIHGKTIDEVCIKLIEYKNVQPIEQYVKDVVVSVE